MNQIKRYVATQIKLVDRFFDLVLCERKKTTIRLGYVFFNNEIISINSNVRSVKIKILKIDYSKLFGTLIEEDAINDGFETLEQLIIELKKFYGEIPDNYPMTIIHFVVVKEDGN